MKYLKFLFGLLAGIGLTAFGDEVSQKNFNGTLDGNTGTIVITNFIPATTTQTAHLGEGVDLRGWDRFALTASYAGVAAGTSNITVTLVRSGRNTTPDLATYETVRPMTWVFPLNGTNTQVIVTNLPRDSVSGITALKLYSVGVGSDALTNLTVKITRKRAG
jgi:hypothetical protein